MDFTLLFLEPFKAFISTDNDGVDDHSGETMFFSIGSVAKHTN